MKRIYLAHSAYRQADARRLQKKLEKMGFEVVNPFSVVPQHTAPGIMVERELREIEKSDALVAFITPECRAAHMEAFYASRILHRPTFVLYKTKIDKGRQTHPWYEYLTLDFLEEKGLLNRLEKWRNE